jgi:hypothetical protein
VKNCGEDPGDPEGVDDSEADVDDDDDGEFDRLPDDDEDAVRREPRSAESSSHPTNTAAYVIRCEKYHQLPVDTFISTTAIVSFSGSIN